MGKAGYTLYFLAKEGMGQFILNQIAMQKPELLKNISPEIFYQEDEKGQSIFSLLTEPDAIHILEIILRNNAALIKYASIFCLVSIEKNQQMLNLLQKSTPITVKTKPSFENLLKTKIGCKILLMYNISELFQKEIQQFQLTPFIIQTLKQTEHGTNLFNRMSQSLSMMKQSNNINRFHYHSSEKSDKKTDEKQTQCTIF